MGNPRTILIVAAWLAMAATPALACTPMDFPKREFPQAAAAERPIIEAYYAASDASDLPGQEKNAKVWLAYDEKSLGKDHWFLAFILERLGMAQGMQNKHAEAQPNFRRAHDLYVKAFGIESPEARDSGLFLVTALSKLERFDEARVVAKPVSEAFDRAACPDSRSALNALKTWAQVSDPTDAYLESAAVWGELAARRQRRFGQGDRESMLAEMLQGARLIDGERAAEALPILTRAAQRYSAATGATSEGALGSQAFMASAQFSMGRFKDAETLSKSVMDTARPELGAKADATLLSEETYLKSLIAQGAYDRAPEAFTTLFTGRIKAFGEDDGATLDMARIGAGLYETLGQTEAAEGLRRKVFAAAVKMRGADSPLALGALDDLADLLTRDDRAAEAETLLKPVWTRIGPKATTQAELETGTQLAVVYIFQERYPDAERLLRDLSVRSTRSLGPRAFTTLNINNNLAIVFARRGRMAEAEALHRETWNSWKAVRGEAHPTTVMSGLQVARSITAESRIPERVKLISQLSETLTNAGQTRAANRTELAVMTAMGQEMTRYGMYDKAEMVWSEMRKTYIQIYGPTSPRTRVVTQSLARALGEQGKHAQAEPLFAELAKAEDGLRVQGMPPSSDWILANAGLGLSRTLQGKAKDGYPSLSRATEAVFARSRDRRSIGSGSEERRKVMADNRYVFMGSIRSGWDYAHER